jgi:polar amino acid transport system permease protein
MNTVVAAFFAIIIGTTLGILFGFILCYGNKYVKFPFRLYVDIIRGMPLLVTIFSIYYLVGFLLSRVGINLTNLTSGIIAISALSTAQVAEITRGALQSIPKGQIEAGKAIGLHFDKIFVFILFPQVIVQIIPPWINTATEMTKASTLLALIGVRELLLATQQLVATSGRALLYYMFIGLIFFLLNTLIQLFGKLLEKKVSF